jgi:hypothetical protein
MSDGILEGLGEYLLGIESQRHSVLVAAVG